MKKLFFSAVGLWCIVCLGLRCYMNTAGFQTGRTAGKGNVEMTGSYHWVFNSPIFFNFDEELEDYQLRNTRSFDLQMNRGFGEKFDMGVHFGSTRLGFDGKYRFLENDGPVALAAGLGVGSILNGGRYVEVPVYFSVHPTEYFAFYFSPGITSVFLGEKNSTYNTSRLDFRGLNTGLFFGKKLQFGFDYGLFNMDTGRRSFTFHNFGFGLKYRFE